MSINDEEMLKLNSENDKTTLKVFLFYKYIRAQRPKVHVQRDYRSYGEKLKKKKRR